MRRYEVMKLTLTCSLGFEVRLWNVRQQPLRQESTPQWHEYLQNLAPMRSHITYLSTTSCNRVKSDVGKTDHSLQCTRLQTTFLAHVWPPDDVELANVGNTTQKSSVRAHFRFRHKSVEVLTDVVRRHAVDPTESGASTVMRSHNIYACELPHKSEYWAPVGRK